MYFYQLLWQLKHLLCDLRLLSVLSRGIMPMQCGHCWGTWGVHWKIGVGLALPTLPHFQIALRFWKKGAWWDCMGGTWCHHPTWVQLKPALVQVCSTSSSTQVAWYWLQAIYIANIVFSSQKYSDHTFQCIVLYTNARWHLSKQISHYQKQIKKKLRVQS